MTFADEQDPILGSGRLLRRTSLTGVQAVLVIRYRPLRGTAPLGFVSLGALADAVGGHVQRCMLDRVF